MAYLLHEYCERFNNWGRWGDDQRGTVTYITPTQVQRAPGLVRTGAVWRRP